MQKKLTLAAFAIAASLGTALAEDNPNFHTVGNEFPGSDASASDPISTDIQRNVENKLEALGIDEAQIRSITVDVRRVKANEDSPITGQDVWVRLNGSGDLVRLSFNGANELNGERSYVMREGVRQPLQAHTR